MRPNKILSASILMFFCLFQVQAQNVKIGDDSSTAHPSSILELNGSDGKGFLVPQITKAQRENAAFIAGISASADNGEGIMVYQTDGEQGIYYWEGARWIKYKPFGYKGIVGNNWDTIANNFVFGSEGTGFTAIESTTGEYDVTFNDVFDTYPTITMTSESNKLPLPDDLPIIPVVCNPTYIADCAAPYNGNHIEAVRIESVVDLDGPGGAAAETQVLQNGVGFLPPTGVNAADIWPFPTNALGGTWMGLTGGIGFYPNFPAAGDYTTQLSGGAWGSITGCSTNGQDPCVITTGNSNHGKYYPDENINATTPCNLIYHPADGGANQAVQYAPRIGKGPNDFFKVFIETTRNWPDQLAVWVDYNRDGDFTDAGEGLGWIDQVSNQGQTPNGLFSHPFQVPVDGGALSGPTAAPAAGQFAVPAGADLGLTTIRVIADWIVVNLLNKPCITSVWGESEDYIVEIYDASVGSAIGAGSEFAYTPTQCGLTEVKGVVGNYTGFKVRCTNLLGANIHTKFHFDVTKNTIY